jgi:pimeloyl-ACP methyl ester carboxylesterase
MQLNFQTYGTGFPVLILHGLFGSLDNWQTVSRKLGETFQVFAVDLRNHGRSPHSDQINYDLMAEDIAEFMQTHGLPRAHVMGHSMGGKVAMLFALQHPERVAKLIVVDIAPKAYAPSHLSILAAMRSLDLSSFQNRNEIDAALAPNIPEPAVRQFLLKNVARTDTGAFKWKLNLPVIDQHYPELIRPIAAPHPFPGPTLFISGGQSDYILMSDHEPIKTLFPHAQFSIIPHSGHWVHAEAPQEFLKTVLNFIR